MDYTAGNFRGNGWERELSTQQGTREKQCKSNDLHSSHRTKPKIISYDIFSTNISQNHILLWAGTELGDISKPNENKIWTTITQNICWCGTDVSLNKFHCCFMYHKTYEECEQAQMFEGLHSFCYSHRSTRFKLIAKLFGIARLAVMVVRCIL